MFSEKIIKNSELANFNSEKLLSVTTYYILTRPTYDQFLQKSAHISSSPIFLLTVSLSLSLLLVQVEALTYPVRVNTSQKEC